MKSVNGDHQAISSGGGAGGASCLLKSRRRFVAESTVLPNYIPTEASNLKEMPCLVC